jgi:hypothetical protein
MIFFESIKCPTTFTRGKSLKECNPSIAKAATKGQLKRGVSDL